MDDASPTAAKRSKLNPEAPAFVNGNSPQGSPPSPQSSPVAMPSFPVAATIDFPSPQEAYRRLFGMILPGGGFDDPPPGTQYVLAWDIEKSGPRTDKHSMLALGAVVVRVLDDRVMAKFRVFMKMEEGHDFSKHCREDYWYNWDRFPMNRKVLDWIAKKGVDPQVGTKLFADWLDKQERKYTALGLALATDNPASDACWVSHYFQKYLDRNPMIHRYGDERSIHYRRLHHSNAFGRALSLDDGSGGDWCDRLRGLGIQVPPDSLHDHDPQNDAMWIAKLYTACLRWVRLQLYGPV